MFVYFFLLTVTLLLVAAVGIVMTGPFVYRFERQVLILASREKIFPWINSPKKTAEWMPWNSIDPKMSTTYSGPDHGVGATSTWESSGKMGTGRAEVIESELNTFVRTQLTYQKPMVMSQLAEISLSSTDQGTTVRWSVTGKFSLMGKLFNLICNMEKFVGAEFEKGLKSLKVLIES